MTSIKTTDLNSVHLLKHEARRAIENLKNTIDVMRGSLPEVPPQDRPIKRFRWSEYFRLILMARSVLEAQVREGIITGYRPTLILGISRGGTIVADLLSRYCSNRPVGFLEARRDRLGRIECDEGLVQYTLRAHYDVLRKTGSPARILIVDDVTDTGHSLLGAVKVVKRSIEKVCANQPEISCEIRTLVLIKKGTSDLIVPDHAFVEVPAGVVLILPYGCA